jgi:hypothetical protein
MDTSSRTIGLLQKEVAYYRQLSARLGKDLARTQQSLERANQEIREHASRRLLERELSLVAATAISLPALCSRVAESVIEHTFCSRVVLLAEVEVGSQSFRILEAAGMSTSELPQEIMLARVPTSAFANSVHCHPSTVTETLSLLSDLTKLPSVMWSYDTETGFAILMATASGPAIAEFDADDEDVANVALERLVDGVWRLRSRQRHDLAWPAPTASIATARAPAPSRGVVAVDAGTPSITEADIVSELRRGGHIAEVAVLERRDDEFLIFVSPSWSKDFKLLRKFRNTGTRTFKDVMRLLRFVRETWGYHGSLTVHTSDAPAASGLISVAQSLEREDTEEQAA